MLSLALLISDAHYRYLENVRQAVSVILYPLQQLPNSALGLLGRIGDFFVTQSALRTENAQLAEQQLRNDALLQRYRSLEAENAHLRELLGARDRAHESMVLAEVLNTARDPFTRRIVIDRGEQQGVAAGAPVIDQTGVIGQVTRTYPWNAEVTLISDREQSVPVQNLRNGLRAVLAGTGNDTELELKFIPLNADFQNGDQLVTSGIDGVYPSGLPVAVVYQVERDAGQLFAHIVCRPAAGIVNHRQVLVINRVGAGPTPGAGDAAAPAKPQGGA
jgi:rod shape-determining protein MreC